MRIAVDIDQTICKTPKVNNSWAYDKSIPYVDRIKKINSLYDEGHTIVYWTARGSSSGIDWSELTRNQLLAWGCKFHELHLGKMSYDLYIDDKSIHSEDYFND